MIGDIDPTVCVVIVTYGDRWPLLREVLCAVDKQTYLPNKIILVNNGSAYSNEQLSISLSVTVQILNFECNMGSAQGFGCGLRKAVDLDVDLIWILDDDNCPVTNALEELVNTFQISGGAVVATRMIQGVGQRASVGTPRNGFLGYSIIATVQSLYKKLARRFIKYSNDISSKNDKYFEKLPVAPYGGLLISKTLIEEIGFPREDFITYADDTEWTSRINATGNAIYRCSTSIVNDIDRSWHVRTTRIIPLISPETSFYKIYYSVRNQTYLEYRSSSSRTLFFLNVVIRLTVLLGNMMVFSENKKASFLRIYVLIKAFYDGLLGKLGWRSEYENSR